MPRIRPRPIDSAPTSARRSIVASGPSAPAAAGTRTDPGPGLGHRPLGSGGRASAREARPARPFAGEGLAASRRELGTLRLDEVKALAEVYREKTATDPTRPGKSSATGSRSSVPAQRHRRRRARGAWPASTTTCSRTGSRPSSCCVKPGRSTRARGRPPMRSATGASARRRISGSRRTPQRGPGPGGDGAESGSLRPADQPRASSASRPTNSRQKLIAKPSFKNYRRFRGQLIEQRVYLDTGSVRYVNLLHAPGELKPRVIADYTLPRLGRKGGPAPAR